MWLWRVTGVSIQFGGIPVAETDAEIRQVIANPDSLTFITGYDALIIGEDTGSGHQNDVIWSYDLGSKQLTRILSTPYGSETTSPYWYPNINGFGYLMGVVQHPYGESDSDQYQIGSMADRGYTGYLGPLPAMGEGKPGHYDYDDSDE